MTLLPPGETRESWSRSTSEVVFTYRVSRLSPCLGHAAFAEGSDHAIETDLVGRGYYQHETNWREGRRTLRSTSAFLSAFIALL